MAMREFVPAARCLGFLPGSGVCHRTLASFGAGLPQPAAGPGRIVENTWRKFFSDPSQWWDHRSEKGTAKYPDFKHKETQEALWINDKLNPVWVQTELAALAPSTAQSNSFAWNRRLARYAKAGRYEKTLDLFQQMQQQGMILDKFTFVPVLNACTGLKVLEEGRRVHTKIMQNGCGLDLYVCSSLIDMFCKCGSVEDAWQVFNRMPTRDVVVWNAMILGYVKCGQWQKALDLSQQMQIELVEPVGVTFVGMLNACAHLRALEAGRRVHKQVMERGFEFDVFVGSSLVDMYAKCGSIKDAWAVFNMLPRRDVVSWNAMIWGYVNCGHGQKALDLLPCMQQEAVGLDSLSFVGLLNACASVRGLEEGKGIHARMIQSGCKLDTFVGSSLIDMYAKCGSVEDALRVFRNLSACNVVCWNAMIQGYLNAGQGQKALEICQEMQQNGVEPDNVTLVGFLKACTSVLALDEGKRVHELIVQRGCESDVFVGSNLVNMYAKCGSIEDAQRVFENMPAHNVMSWNAMILGYIKCGQLQNAIATLEDMQNGGVDPNPATFVTLLQACASTAALEAGKQVHKVIIQCGCASDVFVGTSLVDMYAKCGRIDDARGVFDKIHERDVVSWNVMILGHVKCGQPLEVLELREQMLSKGVEPDPVTFVGLLKACADAVALEEGRRVHKQIIARGYLADVFVASSLLDMYAKCGSIEDAQKLFNIISIHDVVYWTAMLGGYAMHGLAKEALRLFERMCGEGITPNGVTFISLLSACSHAGLVDEGICLFESMSTVYGVSVTVEHCACVVDLLGRAGHLHEVENLIKTIMSFEPSPAVWMPLLGACRVHGNLEMGERIAERILEQDAGNSACYVLLSNIYAAAGRWGCSEKVHRQRLERHVRKQPGCSWIEMEGKVHSFTVDDQKHPRILEIRKALNVLSIQMKEEGYVPESRHEIEGEGKTPHENYHSEKLAIVFGLMNSPPGTPLCIFKNLRVCNDCHTATKSIAKIFDRVIIVRDGSRFHRFEDGLCSCRDYW